MTFYISTGARASESLGVTRRLVAPEDQLIGVVRKGSRALQHLPASANAFVWPKLYQREVRGLVPAGPDDPVWWTLRGPFRRLAPAHSNRGRFGWSGECLGWQHGYAAQGRQYMADRDASRSRLDRQRHIRGPGHYRRHPAAIPPAFEAYATVVLPRGGEGQDQHDQAVLALLSEQSAGQLWWLGYLDTGADDIVFPGAPKVTLYSGWHYVLVAAGPEQAATWRQSGDRSFWKGALPNVMFPADRSWLVSTLWDDDWTCIGGPAGLVDRFLRHPGLRARPVTLGEDATPPGHQAF